MMKRKLATNVHISGLQRKKAFQMVYTSILLIRLFVDLVLEKSLAKRGTMKIGIRFGQEVVNHPDMLYTS